MRVFCPVVESLVPSMLGVGQPSKRGPIAGQLVGDHYPWLAPRRCEHTPQEPFGGVLIAPLLYQDVQHYAMFVDVPPQPMALSFDLQQHLVEMPLVTRAWPSATRWPAAETSTTAGPNCRGRGVRKGSGHRAARQAPRSAPWADRCGIGRPRGWRSGRSASPGPQLTRPGNARARRARLRPGGRPATPPTRAPPSSHGL